jgi:hypothetical protein
MDGRPWWPLFAGLSQVSGGDQVGASSLVQGDLVLEVTFGNAHRLFWYDPRGGWGLGTLLSVL